MRILQIQSRFLFVGLFCFLVTERVEAQLIRITPNGFGGVNIRAPLVRINTNPYGPSHVRAPFVEVNAPPPWYQPQPYYVYPNGRRVYPPTNAAPASAVPNRGGSVVQPPDSVSSGDIAPSWPPGTRKVESNSDAGSGGQPTDGMDRETSRNTNSDLPELKSVLETSVDMESDIQVLRRDLIASSNALQQALARFSNGLDWQEYLALPQWIADQSNGADLTGIDQDRMNQLTKALSRFEKTNSTTEMHLINNLEEFRGAHRELASFVQQLKKQSSQDTTDSSSINKDGGR